MDRCPLSACLAGPLVVWCALSLLDSTFSGFVLLFRPFCAFDAFVVFVCRYEQGKTERKAGAHDF